MRNCGHVHDAEDTHRLRGLAALHFTCDCGSSRIARTPRPRCSARLQESAGAKYGVGIRVDGSAPRRRRRSGSVIHDAVGDHVRAGASRPPQW